MRQLIIIGIVYGLICPLSQCTSDKKVDTEAVKNEIRSREIKKVTEAEIVSKVLELGKSVALGTKQTLGKNLQQALQGGGVENAIDFCSLEAMPLVDSLSENYNADIRRVSLKVRNPKDYPSELEKQILEAYKFQLNDSLGLQANVQPIGEDQYLFTQPIMVEGALCLTCHGKPENGLLKETNDFIKSKYPKDQATGYEIGDLRGMWSITFPKKKVIQSM